MIVGEKIYIGDCVYAVYDGYHIVLNANSPTNPTDTVSLDFSVRQELRKLIDEVDVRDNHGEV